jgi:hypothetical protein
MRAARRTCVIDCLNSIDRLWALRMYTTVA